MAGGKGCGPMSMKVKKMKAGGPTSADRKKYGRNVSRIMNQGKSSRGK
jgi:hypothetical protein